MERIKDFRGENFVEFIFFHDIFFKKKLEISKANFMVHSKT